MTKVLIVAGLGFGDEGKGTVVDFLTRRHGAHHVVRYNGGAQAAHNVVDAEGRHHTFSQFGSGMFAGACTYLSRYMMVNPRTLVNEGLHLVDMGFPAFERLFIAGEALVTTTYHVAMNRAQETARRGNRHGSCGMGIGETMADSLLHPMEVLRVRDLADAKVIHAKLSSLRDRLHSRFRDSALPSDPLAAEHIQNVFADGYLEREVTVLEHHARRLNIVEEDYLPNILKGGTVIFEGAQGALLDQDRGFQPHTTWSDTTFGNAEKLLEGINCKVVKFGVTRTYHTRHGNGPFPTEDLYPWKEADQYNKTGSWQGAFRTGALDLVLLQHGREILGKLHGVAVTHLDQVKYPTGVCTEYSPGFTKQTEELMRVTPVYGQIPNEQELLYRIEQVVGAPALLRSYGPTEKDKKYDGLE